MSKPPAKPARRHRTPLKEDTTFFRHDHPEGYTFSAGNPPPDPKHGWVEDPADIGPPPAKTYECTSFDAYEALIASERKSASAANAQLIALATQLREASRVIQQQNQVIAEQTAVIAKRQSEEG